MTALALISDERGAVLDYERFVDSIAVNSAQRSQRKLAANRFMERHGDPAIWMTRPTATRLVDLHRLKAWPWLTWLFVDRRLRADLELLLAKPPGVDIGLWWTRANDADVAPASEVAANLGWSPNWTRQVLRHTAPVLCLWLNKTLTELTDSDFDTAIAEASTVNVAATTADRFGKRTAALRQVCFQQGLVDRPPRDPRPPARTSVDHAADIPQPAIRRDVVRYAQHITTTLRPTTGKGRIKAIRVLCDWLANQHPDVARLDQLDRTRHIEPFLAWARTRPWRGANGVGKTVGLTVFHQDVVDLRVFFEDIAEWGWPTAPQRRLLFLGDIPRLPEAMPRALAPGVDRDVMAAAARLDDRFARVGIGLLRATGMRVGELLDLELDCIVDFDNRGTWLRVPIGKLGTERMVPLDAETIELFDEWTRHRGPHRSLPHPRDGHPVDFVFCERGRRLGKHRLSQGLHAAVANASLTDHAGRPLHVTLHQLRHTFGTSLVNAGMNLPALMALLGHVTPEMTLRYAKLASPTIRDAYETAMTKVKGRRPLFVIPAGASIAIPAKVDWLHSEMLKTRVAHGFCSRDPIAGSCGYANICEQCDNFVPDPDRHDVLAGQLADVTALRDDAHARGWTDESARHERVATALERHLRRIDRRPADG
ncbi:MAG: site-specific integrase [Actinomycetota bacterium]